MMAVGEDNLNHIYLHITPIYLEEKFERKNLEMVF
jgi:hypothetical protein